MLSAFALSATQAIEHAFKNETVGLVTREQFVEKRTTIEERLKEEEKRQRHEAEEEALRVGGVAAPLLPLWRGKLNDFAFLWAGKQ